MAEGQSISFNVHLNGQIQVINSEDLRSYAEAWRLTQYAPDRFSWLFVLNMLIYERLHGINPFHITDEIRDLEGSAETTRTKPPSQFSHEPLRGLWHKHFFAGRFIAHNITNHLAGGRLKELVDQVCDPRKSAVLTESMVKELAHRVTVESLEQRADASRLTGEWIVFAKHQGQNYYLCLATHEAGDDAIFENIKAGCWPQFPFLAA